MKTLKTALFGLLSVLVAATSVTTFADEVSDRINAALAHPDRDPEDAARDQSRKPVQVVNFIGVETGMTILDVASSSGWYAEVLAAAVGPDGTIIAQNSERFAERVAPAQALKIERYPNIMPITAESADGYGVDGQADVVWVGLNLHDAANRSRESGLQYLGAIYDALKPGGVAAIIDHEGSVGMNNAELHRIDVGSAIEIIEAAGFVVEEQSYVLNNPADDHTLHQNQLERNTDRFVLKVRKPL